MIPHEGPLNELNEQAQHRTTRKNEGDAPTKKLGANAPVGDGVVANGGVAATYDAAPAYDASSVDGAASNDAASEELAIVVSDIPAVAEEPANSEEAEPAREAANDAPTKKSETEINLGSHTVNYGMIFKFLGLIAFIALMALIMYLIWPTISGIFEEGGAEKLVEEIRNAGSLGVLMLLGLQFLQIVVAFIPGEVVQVAAGMMYGPWLGALIIIAGCVGSSAFIYWLVHKLGAPFVQAMVPEKFLNRLNDFESSGKLNVVVFVLFLIPGLPKDTFTYIVPLTRMRMGTFLILSNVARIPGVVLSTYAANGIMEGNILTSVLLFLVAAGLACIGLYAGRKYMDYKLEKEDPEEWRKVKAKRDAKKADRRAKRAKRRARRAKAKAKKRAQAYEEYKQASMRMRQYNAASEKARMQEQEQVQAAAQGQQAGQTQQAAQPRPQAQQVGQPRMQAQPQTQVRPQQPQTRAQAPQARQSRPSSRRR